MGEGADWVALGRAIANLHRRTGDRFGWHRDNFQGMTVQPNRWSDDWPSFYVERRMRPHLADPRVPAPLRRRIDRACDGPLPALLRPRPPALLTHGDLWAANVVEGRWLVDPAVSFADRELELAYMQLSNSLPAELLAAYLEEWPPDPSYEQRPPRAPAAQVPQQHSPLRARPIRASDRGGPGWLRLVSRRLQPTMLCPRRGGRDVAAKLPATRPHNAAGCTVSPSAVRR